MGDRGLSSAHGALDPAGGSDATTLPSFITPAPQVVRWIDIVIDAAEKAGQSVVALALASPATRWAAEVLVSALHSLIQARKIVDALEKFFVDSEINPGAIQGRAQTYRSGAAKADVAGELGAETLGRLNRVWEGQAAGEAARLVLAWARFGPQLSAQLTSMAAATLAAGAGFGAARQAAEDCVTESTARIQASVPSVTGIAGQGGWGWLTNPGREAVEAIIRLVLETANMIRTLCNEIGTLAQRVIESAQPGIKEGSRQLGVLDRLGTQCDRAAQCLLTGTDPGPLPMGKFPTQTFGREHQDADATLLQLSAALDSHATPLPAGWTELSPEQLGLNPTDPRYATLLKDDPLGFQAHVARGPHGEIVVVTEGTDGFNEGQDWAENATGALRYSHQSAKVQQIVDVLTDNGMIHNTVFTGHSLGGKLATVGAAATGNPAVTFQAAGLNDPTVSFYAGQRGISEDEIRHSLDAGGQARAYRTTDDILTYAQESAIPALPDAAGTPITMEGTHWGPLSPGHMMPNVLDSYTNKYGITFPRLPK